MYIVDNSSLTVGINVSLVPGGSFLDEGSTVVFSVVRSDILRLGMSVTITVRTEQGSAQG